MKIICRNRFFNVILALMILTGCNSNSQPPFSNPNPNNAGAPSDEDLTERETPDPEGTLTVRQSGALARRPSQVASTTEDTDLIFDPELGEEGDEDGYLLEGGSDQESPQWILILHGKEIVLKDCIFAHQRNRTGGDFLVLQQGKVLLKDGRVVALEDSGLALEDGEQIVLMNGRLVPVKAGALARGELTDESSRTELARSRSELLVPQNGRVILKNCSITLENCSLLEDGRLIPIRYDDSLLINGTLPSDRNLIFGIGTFALKDGQSQPTLKSRLSLKDAESPESSDSTESEDPWDEPETAAIDFDEKAFEADQAFARRISRRVPPAQVELDREARKFAFGQLLFRGQEVLKFADWILAQPQPLQALKQYTRAYFFGCLTHMRLSQRKAREFAQLFSGRSPRAFGVYQRAYTHAVKEMRLSHLKAREFA
jgi:hypothetical protein